MLMWSVKLIWFHALTENYNQSINNYGVITVEYIHVIHTTLTATATPETARPWFQSSRPRLTMRFYQF